MKAPTMTEQLKQKKGKENVRTEQRQRSQSYSMMEVQDKQGKSETNNGSTRKPEKTGMGQKPPRDRDSSEMSNQSSKNLSVTIGDELTWGEKQLEAGSEK